MAEERSDETDLMLLRFIATKRKIIDFSDPEAKLGKRNSGVQFDREKLQLYKYRLVLKVSP